MAWYWYLVIAGIVVVAIILVILFGNSKLKSLAYQLVVNAEKLVGSGKGEEKYNLVIKKLSTLTKGIIPEWLLKKAVETAVSRMKLLLEENSESIEKHLKNEEDTTNGDVQN